MARSLYVMPITTTTLKGAPARFPKYKDSHMLGFDWSMFDYGDEPWCLVGIQDISPAARAALEAEADVFPIPDNLDQSMGTTQVRNQVRTRLEQADIPGQWVQTTTTWREVVRFVGAVCQYAQRYQGMVGGLWFPGNVNLNSTYGSQPQAVQDGMLAAASSFPGMSTGAFQAGNDMRTVVQSIGDQYVGQYVTGNPRYPLDLEGPL